MTCLPSLELGHHTGSLFDALRGVLVAVLVLAKVSTCGDVAPRQEQYNRPIHSIVTNNGRIGFDCSDSVEMRRFTKLKSEIFHPLERCYLSADKPIMAIGYVDSSVDSLNSIFCDDLGQCVTIDNQQIASVQYLQPGPSNSRPNEYLGLLIHIIPAAIGIGLGIYFAQGLKTM